MTAERSTPREPRYCGVADKWCYCAPGECCDPENEDGDELPPDDTGEDTNVEDSYGR